MTSQKGRRAAAGRSLQQEADVDGLDVIAEKLSADPAFFLGHDPGECPGMDDGQFRVVSLNLFGRSHEPEPNGRQQAEYCHNLIMLHLRSPRPCLRGHSRPPASLQQASGRAT
ncbi:hypothetical protein ACFY94_26100 [Streptomyces griseorubiginosus]|uniref:hypothetical protein n=1 Tax=Streptomyces griseorubiginosus TaxID=67304 RepID=UPI0036E0F111